MKLYQSSEIGDRSRKHEKRQAEDGARANLLNNDKAWLACLSKYQVKSIVSKETRGNNISVCRALGRDLKRNRPLEFTLYKNAMTDEKEARKVLSEIYTLGSL